MRCSIKQKMRNDAHTAVTLSSRRDYIADTAREIWRAHTQGYSPCRILESAERARTIVARGPNPQQAPPQLGFRGNNSRRSPRIRPPAIPAPARTDHSIAQSRIIPTTQQTQYYLQSISQRKCCNGKWNSCHESFSHATGLRTHLRFRPFPAYFRCCCSRRNRRKADIARMRADNPRLLGRLQIVEIYRRRK